MKLHPAWLICLAASFATAAASAEDWPKWRGPRGDGISRETGLLKEWPSDGPKRLWSRPIGLGFSSPIAADGKVYIFTLVDNKEETLQCFSADAGELVWTQTYEGGWTQGGWPGTRATPVIEDDRIYTYGGAGDLICRNLDDGKLIWRTNVLTESGSRGRKSDWGQASSPLIEGEKIFVQGSVGPVAFAVNKSDGKIIWQAEQGQGGYAHPILADVQGTSQLIVFGGHQVYGLNPADGRTIWSLPWATSYDVNATTPIYNDGLLLISSGYSSGSMMLKLTPTRAEKLWEERVQAHIRNKFQGMILDNGYVYAVSEPGTLKCMSWPDGKIIWESRDPRLGAGGSIVRFGGDRMVSLSERGKLYLLQATPEGAEVLGEVDVAENSKNWSTPLIYNGKLYVQTMVELICFDISAR